MRNSTAHGARPTRPTQDANGAASADGARSEAQPSGAVVGASLWLAAGTHASAEGARSEAQPSEAVVDPGLARIRTHN